ncbi:hypothetical protein NCC49_001058 [Naganishia albida]|nr:hypothetical protein NCC49_001058 [Naganishia albida]
MSTLKEIAPFFGPGTDPAIVKDAQGILQSLKGGIHAWTGQQRPALAGISALLACERHGQPLVSHSAAQKTSATSVPVFNMTFKKCRELLSSTSASTSSASGRKSMASPRASTSRASTTPVKNAFDPLNLPGSSAKKVMAPVGRRATRDLSDLRKMSGSTPVENAKTTAVSTSTTAPTTKAKEKSAIIDKVSQGSTEALPEKRKAPPSPSVPLIPPGSPSRPAPPTPQTPSKTRPTTATGRASLAASPTPRRLASRTPTGHGSPMHNALMKGKLEMASAVRSTGGKKRLFEEEEEEEGEVTSPSKRQKAGPSSATREARKGVDLVELINSPDPDAAPAKRAIVSAQRINSLFRPLPACPLDPYTSIPQPPLVFSGPSIFYAPTLAQGRVAAKMVPPDDVAWGDPYSLMSHRKRGQGSLSVLSIEVGQVGEASTKRERARKRRLKRLERVESGFATGEGVAEWDREFGVPIGVGADPGIESADWQERLDLYHAKSPAGLRAIINALSQRIPGVTLPSSEPLADPQDRQWIARAESHGIAIRVHQDA